MPQEPNDVVQEAVSSGDRGRERPIIPPIVYLPTTVRPGPDGQSGIELRSLPDGRVALLAYTALDRFVDCLGPHQPWGLVHTDRLHEIARSQPYDVIFLDIPLPPEQHVGPADG